MLHMRLRDIVLLFERASVQLLGHDVIISVVSHFEYVLIGKLPMRNLTRHQEPDNIDSG